MQADDVLLRVKAIKSAYELNRPERIYLHYRHECSGPWWDKAVEIYGTLRGFFPDNLEYGLRLASVQTGERAEALLAAAQKVAPSRGLLAQKRARVLRDLKKHEKAIQVLGDSPGGGTT